MAPPADAAKALQSNRTRPTVMRPIIPAIPLPYITKRKQNTAPPKAPAVGVAATPTPTVASSTATPAADGDQLSTNGTIADAEATVAVPELETGADVIKDSEKTDTGAIGGASEIESHGEQYSEAFYSGSVKAKRHGTSADVAPTDSQKVAPSAPSLHQAESTASYKMPPPFYPANHDQSAPSSAESIHHSTYPSFDSHNTMQHGPPSVTQGFGRYSDSGTSSPAPPASARGPNQMFFQSASQDGENGQVPLHVNGHSHSTTNGFSSMGMQGPPPGFLPRHEAHAENLGRRQVVSFVPPTGYSPSTTPSTGDPGRYMTFEQSTPHGFHGSQSSLQHDFDSHTPPFFSPYGGPMTSNGANGHYEDPRMYQPHRQNGRHGSHSMPGAHGNFAPQHGSRASAPVDNLDGLMGYLLSQLSDRTFADCTLQLWYPGAHTPFYQVVGHNLLFARSPTLKNLMTEQTEQRAGETLQHKTLRLESNDRFLRADAVWLATQRLYGGPLLDPMLPSVMPNSPSLPSQPPMSGHPAERFDLALAYAAAGHVLQMPPVTNRGIDIATHTLRWETLEKALDFALDGGLDSQWTLEDNRDIASTYGPAANILLHHVLKFIISSFPPNFELDTSVSEPKFTGRLPTIKDSRPLLPNPRLSSIKFGDHSVDEASPTTGGNFISTTLSLILLTLPFPLLKYVLESPRLGSVEGWASAKLRQKVMHTVVEEREKRRAKTFNSHNVTNEQRLAARKQWEVVGWQESVSSINGPETTILGRHWVDFVLPTN